MVTGSTVSVEIYRGWCKKCGICIAFCPRQILASDEAGYPVLKDPDRCSACNLCADRCPDFAIAVVSARGNKRNNEKVKNGEKKDDKPFSSSRQ